MCVCVWEDNYLATERHQLTTVEGVVEHSSSYRVPVGGLTGTQLIGTAILCDHAHTHITVFFGSTSFFSAS